jgi:hypothetical protein
VNGSPIAALSAPGRELNFAKMQLLGGSDEATELTKLEQRSNSRINRCPL